MTREELEAQIKLLQAEHVTLSEYIGDLELKLAPAIRHRDALGRAVDGLQDLLSLGSLTLRKPSGKATE
jgi:hypothetical protein